jgi:hypothetical protein
MIDSDRGGLWVMHRLSIATIATCVTCFSSTILPQVASAADMPVKAPPRAAVVATDNYYVWLDGSYQSIRLPKYALGWQATSTGSGGTSTGPVDSYEPRPKGFGIAGAVGYFLPQGTLIGTRGRIELGWSIVQADTTQSGGTSLFAPNGGSALQLLNGTLDRQIGCGTPGCTTTSSLETKYKAWQVGLKAESDVAWGAFMLSPSLGLFGGRTKTDQNFSQQNSRNIIGTFNAYTVDSSLGWTDWGARLGVQSRLNASTWLTFGLAGSVGFAVRNVSLSASDTSTDLDAPSVVTGSTISPSAHTAAFLANAEASVTARASQSVALRAFVGLNYDSRVPGISSPDFAGGAPAGIKFASETSYYAGGGLAVKF